MDKAKILDLFDREQRREVEYYPFKREETPRVVRHINQNMPLGTSAVTYSRLTPDNTDAVIEAEITYFEQLGHSFEWKVYDHDQPADLRQRLQARGFKVGDAEALMVLEIEHAPAQFLQPVQPDVRRITTVEGIADAAAVQAAVWPEADFIQWLAADLEQRLRHDPDHISIYVAYVNGVPASSAWISFHSGSRFAGLWGGSTLPQFRQQGLYSALVAARLQEAHSRGVRYLTIDASPMSRAVLEKRGFQWLTTTYPCVWTVKSG
jgi:GNAT superfamily N-acetyltransferase